MTQFIKGMRDKLGKYVDETLAFTVEMSVDGNLVCDACCFCVDEHGKLVNEESMIFYNQVETPGKEIRYSQLGDKINFDIQLENLPSEIQKLVFTFSIDGEGKVEDARQFSLCVKQNDVACIVVEANQQDFIKGKSVILAEIYRKNGWKFANVSGGFAGNLEQLVEFFGAQASYESEIPEQEAGCIESDFVEVKPEEMANEFEDEDYDRDESEAEDYAEDADEESEVNDFEDEDYGDEESEDSEDENYDDSDDYSEEDDYDESDDDSEDDDYDESDDDSEEAYDDDEESDEEDYDEEDYDDEDYDDEEYDEEDYDDFMEVEPTEIEPEKAGKLTMKKIKVNEKCSGCGFCVVNCPYLEENNEGNAQPVLGKMIAESDLAAMEKLVQECPQCSAQ